MAADITISNKRTIQRAIVVVGKTGTGKSFICNHLGDLFDSEVNFKTRSSVSSVQQVIEKCPVIIDGKITTLIECPGFADTSPYNEAGAVDAKRVCKLVKTLEDIEELVVVVFVFTDRFDMMQRIWYERIREILSSCSSYNMILLHNKLGDDLAPDDINENEAQLKKMLNLNKDDPNLNYLPLSFRGGPRFDFDKAGLLTKIKSFSPVKLTNLVVPQICYQSGEIVGEIVERVTKKDVDKGQMVEEVEEHVEYVPHHALFDRILGAKVHFLIFTRKIIS